VPETVSGIIADLTSESQVDATSAQLLRDLNRRWASMLSDAKAYRKQVSVGTTTAGTAFYALSVLEAYYFSVDGAPFGKARRPDIYGYEQGALVWVGQDTGLIVADANASGIKGITLIPTPSESGLAIEAFAAVSPPELTNDAAGDTLLTANLETDLMGPLTSGVMADRYRRDHRWDLVASAEADFSNGVEKLRRRAARRFRGSGPSQIRIIGVTA
jgi:hypothetical protein